MVIDERDEAALGDAAEHVAAVVEQARNGGALDAIEIFGDRALAFRREEIAEMAPQEILAVVAEQRFGAAVAGVDVALGVEHHDAFGGGVENGGEILGIDLADHRRWRRADDGVRRGRRHRRCNSRSLGRHALRRREHQGQRGFAVP